MKLKSRHTFLFAAAGAILFNWLVLTGAAAAAGFAVSPSSLEFIVEKGSQAQKQLRIYNIAEEGTDFRAISSNSATIKVSPEKGFIEGEGSALVTLMAAGAKIGESEEEVVISFGNYNSDDRREVNLELGTAVPVKLTVFKKAKAAANVLVGVLLSASIVLAGLTAYYLARKKPGKLAANFQSAYDLYLLRK